jgi:hypothetical protein
MNQVIALPQKFFQELLIGILGCDSIQPAQDCVNIAPEIVFIPKRPESSIFSWWIAG